LPRILLIEDDDQLRTMLRQVLTESGYQVSEAQNGEQGLEQYAAAPVDVVVTDILMPRKDGVETIRELLRRDPAIRIIAMTGLRGTYSRLPAAEYLGARATLVKPFHVRELLDAIEGLLE